MPVKHSDRYLASRRRFLKQALAVGAAGSLPGISWATTPMGGNSRLVLIILRGAMDGLSAVIPFSEPELANWRAPLVPAENTLLKLDHQFALHPAFENMFQLHQQGELAIIHAVATPYRQRSHFDGQNVLENGLEQAGIYTGWLNRALQHNSNTQAMAIGQAIPLVLRGATSVPSWTPPNLPPVNDDTLNRLVRLYNHDAYLGPRLEQALIARNIAGSRPAMSGQNNQGFNTLVTAAVNFLSAPDGPNVVVLENDGWDTHAGQGNEQGTLARKFVELDVSISRLKAGLASKWKDTAVVVVTEFGRTVRVNGALGTDHGTGGVAFVAGGALALRHNASSVLGNWPGLAEHELHEGRDLQATTDLRSVLKTVLHQHLGYSYQMLNEQVFPGSQDAGPLAGLF